MPSKPRRIDVMTSFKYACWIKVLCQYRELPFSVKLKKKISKILRPQTAFLAKTAICTREIVFRIA